MENKLFYKYGKISALLSFFVAFFAMFLTLTSVHSVCNFFTFGVSVAFMILGIIYLVKIGFKDIYDYLSAVYYGCFIVGIIVAIAFH